MSSTKTIFIEDALCPQCLVKSKLELSLLRFDEYTIVNGRMNYIILATTKLKVISSPNTVSKYE